MQLLEILAEIRALHSGKLGALVFPVIEIRCKKALGCMLLVSANCIQGRGRETGRQGLSRVAWGRKRASGITTRSAVRVTRWRPEDVASCSVGRYSST